MAGESCEKRLAQKILRRGAIHQEKMAAAYHQVAKDELREIGMEEDKALTIPGLYLVPAVAYTSLSSDKKGKAEDGEGRAGSDGEEVSPSGLCPGLDRRTSEWERDGARSLYLYSNNGCPASRL